MHISHVTGKHCPAMCLRHCKSFRNYFRTPVSPNSVPLVKQNMLNGGSGQAKPEERGFVSLKFRLRHVKIYAFPFRASEILNYLDFIYMEKIYFITCSSLTLTRKWLTLTEAQMHILRTKKKRQCIFQKTLCLPHLIQLPPILLIIVNIVNLPNWLLAN